MRESTWRYVNAAGNKFLSPPRRCFGHYLNHGDRTERRLALTFDDGPSVPSTPLLLDVLDRLDVRATFFCVGEMVAHHPNVVQRAFDEGHVIGNHSMSHHRRPALTPFDARHVDDADDAIYDAIGVLPALYRPPWGWLTPWAARRAQRRGLHCVGWDVYPDDWMVPETPAEVTAEQVRCGVRNGSIVLMHDGRAVYVDCDKTQTAAAVERFVPRLRDAGFEFVTVPELLGVEAYRTSALVLARAG
ncbi:MAG: polysaccharide deacetylase family protein [Ilumatobacteraceae bacterium]